ncbi:21858_t:CDS:2 [Dentiscutata erythropus]|uniref:21858_t:CDS:1 n=1 Tax=Dentiscutata erythropus TaxID=1348616 RepID=A0A9N9D563_9GLOM|nr:21858_t:CDS:2 [Dentiscutata erythropus]
MARLGLRSFPTTDDSLYFSALKLLRVGPEFIPPRTNLLEYIQQPFIKPIEVHPINYNLYFKSKLDPDAFDKFFVNSLNASSRLWSEYLIQIPCPPKFGLTEDSFHSFWDALIFKPFKIACPSGNFNRNSNCHTYTKRFLPDFSYLVFDACLARGEKKGPDNNDNPAAELISKLTWTYGNCPYIFGYYAHGTVVTYCYLYFEENQVKRKDLVTCLLENLEGRIQAFNIGINIGRLLPLLRQTLPE